MEAFPRPDLWNCSASRIGLIAKTKNELIYMMSIERIFYWLKFPNYNGFML